MLIERMLILHIYDTEFPLQLQLNNNGRVNSVYFNLLSHWNVESMEHELYLSCSLHLSLSDFGYNKSSIAYSQGI